MQHPSRPAIALRLVLATVLGTVVTSTVLTSTVHATTASLAVRVYDFASVPDAPRSSAIGTAAAILGDAGVPAWWHDCTGGRAGAACVVAGQPGELIVRIVPTSSARDTGAHASFPGPANDHVTLGAAIIGQGQHAGALATIFFDQVQVLAQRTGLDLETLLGRVIAHEVGHLLLNTNTHGRNGLMREVWTDEELSLNRASDWLFAPADRRTLGLTIAERSRRERFTARASARLDP